MLATSISASRPHARRLIEVRETAPDHLVPGQAFEIVAAGARQTGCVGEQLMDRDAGRRRRWIASATGPRFMATRVGAWARAAGGTLSAARTGKAPHTRSACLARGSLSTGGGFAIMDPATLPLDPRRVVGGSRKPGRSPVHEPHDQYLDESFTTFGWTSRAKSSYASRMSSVWEPALNTISSS